MYDLVELWALLAPFLSEIFDQVGSSEWSALREFIRLWRSETGARVWYFVRYPSPPTPPPAPLVSDAQTHPAEALGFAISPLGFAQWHLIIISGHSGTQQL